MSFEAILNWIVLIGAAVAAITSLIKVSRNGGQWMKEKNKEQIASILKELLPECLEAHEAIIRTKREEDFNRIIKAATSDSFDQVLDQIKQLNTIAEKHSEDLSLLKNGDIELLRREIHDIYNKNRLDKTLVERDKRDLVDMVGTYFKLGGNSYVEDLWNEMRDWEVVPTKDK